MARKKAVRPRQKPFAPPVNSGRTPLSGTAAPLPSTGSGPDAGPDQRRGWLALIVLLLAGFAVRILHVSDLSLWVDEYVHVMRAKHFLEGQGPLLADDNNGILFTVCLLPGFAAFGATVFWARFPSVLFGVALLFLMYRMGARLFNRFVGLFAAAGGAFSLYLIFWSRVCRNYAPLAFFYLLLGLVFLAAFERNPAPESADRWERMGLSRRHLLWLPVVGLLSLLSHQLTFFFAFTVAVYALVRFAFTYATEGPQPERAKLGWLTALTLPLLLLVFVPPLGNALKSALAPFLMSNIAEWAIPDWNRLAGLSADKPLDAFQLYNNLMQYDLRGLYWPALAGLLAALWLRPRSGLWLASSVVVPVVLLSFVFREPFLQRYLIFAYPYLLISAGVFFYGLWELFRRRVWPAASAGLQTAFLAIAVLLVLWNARWGAIADLALARKQEGHVVDTRLASWSFTDWKEACAFVARKRQVDDVLISTVPTAVSYYLDRENVLWFRQAYYDMQEKRYKLNPPNPGGGPGAGSLEDLIRTVQQAPRGWLLADYYLENVFTDERALLWVYQNLKYYPEASGNGSVMVFGWDHSQPKPERQNLVVELGRNENKIESKVYHMTLPEQLFSTGQIEMTVRTAGIDSDREALVLFNEKNAVWLPPNKGNGVEESVLPLDRNWIKPGPNAIQILYETKRPSDPRRGFTLYYLGITGK